MAIREVPECYIFLLSQLKQQKVQAKNSNSPGRYGNSLKEKGHVLWMTRISAWSWLHSLCADIDLRIHKPHFCAPLKTGCFCAVYYLCYYPPVYAGVFVGKESGFSRCLLGFLLLAMTKLRIVLHQLLLLCNVIKTVYGNLGGGKSPVILFLDICFLDVPESAFWGGVEVDRRTRFFLSHVTTRSVAGTVPTVQEC